MRVTTPPLPPPVPCLAYRISLNLRFLMYVIALHCWEINISSLCVFAVRSVWIFNGSQLFVSFKERNFSRVHVWRIAMHWCKCFVTPRNYGSDWADRPSYGISEFCFNEKVSGLNCLHMVPLYLNVAFTESSHIQTTKAYFCINCNQWSANELISAYYSPGLLNRQSFSVLNPYVYCLNIYSFFFNKTKSII